jgi:general secretion pathway protein D
MTPRLFLATGLLLLGRLGAAEPVAAVPPAEAAPAVPTATAVPPPAEAAPAVPAAVAPPEVAAPATAAGVPASAAPAPPLELAAETPPVRPSDNPELRLNFKGAPLDTVLDYLSRAGGFIIVRDAPVSGTVDIVSHNPLTADEAVALLHTVLNDRGLAVIRTDRTLRIVRRDDARARDIPVVSGNDPTEVPRTSEMVTQVISLRHTKATKLMETLKPLVPTGATMTVNEDGNALVITDTRANIRRLLEVIQAVDSTVSSILDIQVIALSYADATETAEVINKVYETPSAKAGAQASGGGRGAGEFFARMRGFGGEGGGDGGGADTSTEVRQTASYVKAVADQRGNAVIVTAPAEVLPQIAELVVELDQPSEAVTTLRVFPLRYADATKIANVLVGLYPDTTTSSSSRGSAGGGGGQRGFFGRMPFGPQAQTQQSSSQSQRKLSEAKVLAVADTRTNSVVVSASSTTMADIEKVVTELDTTPANVPVVHVYQLENADVTRAKDILDSMFDDLESSGTSTGSSSTRRTSTSGTTRNSPGTTTQRGTGGTGSSTGSSTR